MTFRGTPQERIEKYSMPEPNSGCWIWLGIIDGPGYGIVSIKRRSTKAHRFSWELHRGPIPDGLCVCHVCDNRLCINPDHLFLGTKLDNCRDMYSKGRNVNNSGVKHWHAKITEAQARKIKRSRLLGHVLMKRYGLSKAQISAIRTGRSWKHI